MAMGMATRSENWGLVIGYWLIGYWSIGDWLIRPTNQLYMKRGKIRVFRNN